MFSCQTKLVVIGTVPILQHNVFGVFLRGDDGGNNSQVSSEWTNDFDDEASSTQSGVVGERSNARFQTLGMLYDQTSQSSSDRSEHMKCEAMSIPSTISSEWVDPRQTEEHKELMAKRTADLKSDVNSELSGESSSYISGNTILESEVLDNASSVDGSNVMSDEASSSAQQTRGNNSQVGSEWTNDFDDEASSTPSGVVGERSNARFQTLGMLYDQTSQSSSDRSEHMKCEAMSIPSTISSEWVDPRETEEHKERMAKRTADLKSVVNSELSGESSSYISGNTILDSEVFDNARSVDGSNIMSDEASSSTQQTREQLSTEFQPVDDPDDESVFYQASESDFTRDWRSAGDIVSERDEHGELVGTSGGNLEDWKLFIIAAETNNVKEMEILLENDDLDINAVEENGCTALFVACQHNHVDVVRLLLKQEKIDVLKAGQRRIPTAELRVTPLVIACEQGYVEVVEVFLSDTRTDVNQSHDTWTPLLGACFDNQLPVVQELLKHPDINVNQAKNTGSTPLLMACQNGHLPVVQELLKHPDINVNQAKNDDATPLFVACQNGHLPVVQEVLKHPDINVNQAKNDDATPAFVACCRGHSEVVQDLLLFPKTEVHQLCYSDDASTFPILLKPITRYYNSENFRITVGVNEDNVLVAKFNSGTEGPITWEEGDGYKLTVGNNIFKAQAESNGFQDIGSAPNAPDAIPNELIWVSDTYPTVIWRSESVGPTPTAFLAACQNGHAEVVQSFISQGYVNLDITFQDGTTALEMATRNNHEDVVKLLEDFQATTSSENIAMNTADTISETEITIAMDSAATSRPKACCTIS